MQRKPAQQSKHMSNKDEYERAAKKASLNERFHRCLRLSNQ